MGETGGTDRVLPTAGTRLGAQPPMGVSTLEPGHMPSPRTQEKHLHVRVKLLDCTVEAFDMEPRCDGQTLLTQLWERLHLLESDYFGLEFQNGPSSWVWLEPTKPIVRQVRRPKSALFRLAVKFFPPDPGQLREEYTRYLFALQLKRDLLEERLPCASTTAALLTSHFLQAEVGDYDEAVDREHLGTHAYLPGQGPCLEKTLEFHRRHTGQTPAESDFQVLEIARKLEMYGIRFHTASDREGTKINLAVSHMGVLVFQGTTKINTFNWSKVRKLSFKRRRFLIKLHPEVHGPYQDTLEFLLGSRDACKNFWKICVEHHTFFRLLAQPKPKAKAVLFSRGSSFRYSGRTQRQLVEYVKDGGAARLPYERRHSKAGPSVRALTTDLPKQSISFNESLRTSSWSSANTCFYPLPASPPARPSPPGLKDSSGSTPEPPGPAAEKSSMAVVAGPSPQPASQPGPPAPPSGPGFPADGPQPAPSSQKSPPSPSPAFQATLGPAERNSSPLLSPVLSDAGGTRVEEEELPGRKRVPEDQAYFIAKEILATERTYLKDLEVLAVWFRSAVVKEDAMPATLMTLLFSNVDPLYEFHRGFLREVEQRLALWEGPPGAQTPGHHQRVGDVLLRGMRRLQEFTHCFQSHAEVLAELGRAARRCRKLAAVYREFELQKVCYLPLSAFLLKPGQRLLQYRLLLHRLCAHYPPGHCDQADCLDALAAITEVTSRLQPSLAHLENLQTLTELQRGLAGMEGLIVPGRELLREGCLLKLTKKGLQQRMFFLFSDVLLYTSDSVPGAGHFRIRGLLPLRGMLVEESESQWSVPHCFTIYTAQKTVVVAASTRWEKQKWVLDLNNAIQAAKSGGDTSPALPGSTHAHPSRPTDEVPPMQESEEDALGARGTPEGQSQPRVNTTMHVCWHRNTSVSRADLVAAAENQLSGYLLRKFKNSHGWQRLWVVFTNFCLFFYKTHQDDYPLASLPLLGYHVGLPGEADGIHKDCVFKLQFKSHVYFFRADSKYTLSRWMEVIEASSSPGRPPGATQDGGPHALSGLEE